MTDKTDKKDIGGASPAEKPYYKNGKFNEIAYKNDFSKKNYTQIAIPLPKSRTQTWRDTAKAEGKSMSAFIQSAVEDFISENYPENSIQK